MNIKLDIPSGFFEGEERSGYYVSPEMKRVWAVQLDLISEFSRVCEKYGLKWQIGYGTLLGAVRHKGFIPWDDDVDIIMMRQDYERFLKAADEFRPPYRLGTMYSGDKRMGIVFAKLYNASTAMIESDTVRMMKAGVKLDYSQGIFIDIFPIDDIPDDEAEADKFIRRATALHKEAISALYWTNYYPAKNILKRPIKAFLHRIFTMRKTDYFPLMAKFDEFIKSCPNPKSKRTSLLVFCYVDSENWGGIEKVKAKRIWDRSLYDGTVNLPFEMLSFPAPARYEDVLTHIYGDWRTPIVIPNHGAIYDTEHPYTDYIKDGSLVNFPRQEA